MNRTRLTLCLALLTALAFASGCSLFGGDDNPASGGTVNTAKLVKMVIPIAADTDTAVTKAPARAADATTLNLEFYDAKTLAKLVTTGAPDYTTTPGSVIVTGEFAGVTVLVRVISKADATKKKDVLLGIVPDDANAAVVEQVTSKVKIAAETIVATQILINATAGADTETKIKALAATVTYKVTDDSTTATTNTVLVTAVAVVDQVSSGAIATTGATTADKLVNLLELITAGTTTIDAVKTTVDTRLAQLHTVTGVTSSIAKKDVATNDITITGTNFGADATKIVVTITGTGVDALTKTDANITLGGTAAAGTIKFKFTVAEAAARAGIELTVKVKKIIAVGDEPELTLPTKVIITPAVLDTIAIRDAAGAAISSTPTVLINTTTNFTVYGTYDDGTVVDVTGKSGAGIVAGSTALAAVGTPVTAFAYTAPGTVVNAEGDSVTLTASYGGKTATQAILVITSPLVGLKEVIAPVTAGDLAADAPKVTYVKTGFSINMLAVGDHEAPAFRTNQNANVNWSVDNTNLATIDANGALLGKAAGSVVVTATHKTGVGATYTKTATITVVAPSLVTLSDPPAAGIKKGATHTFTVTANFGAPASETGVDVTSKATFTVTKNVEGNGTFAANGGVFTGSASGLASIKATLGGVDSAAKSIYIYGGNPNATFTAANVTINVGAKTATVTWTTSYEVKGGQLWASDKDSFETDVPGIGLNSRDQYEDITTPSKNHSVTVTLDAVSPAADISGAANFRFRVDYQFGTANEDIFEGTVVTKP